MKAAGIMYVSGNSVLLLKRTDAETMWAFPGGHVEEGETELQAAIRESKEETDYVPSESVVQYDFSNREEVEFTTFLCHCPTFSPTLNEEHTGYLWADMNDLPDNLHPGVKETLDKYKAGEIKNALDFPKMYYCRHMQPGTCNYPEHNEIILIDTDAMKRMIASGAGKPVYIDHPNNSVVDRLKNIKKEAVGYIADSFYNEIDGWAWFKFLVIDEKARDLCDTPGMAVSNGYAAMQWGMDGTKNNVPYKRELLIGEFTQLAIVPNPRYEGACIMTPEQFKSYQDNKKRELEELHNSKPKKETTPMFFRTKKEEVKAGETIGDDVFTEITNDDGTVEQVKVKDLIALKAEEIKNAKMKKNSESEGKQYDIDGEQVSEEMLKDCYKNMKKNEKKNKEDEESKDHKKDLEEEKKKAEAEEAKEKKNADDKMKEEEEEEEKKNSKYFEELSNANRRAETAPPKVHTSQSKLALGKARYGKVKKD